MAYLIGEVLMLLAAAALIGAGMAWMLRSLRSHARERQLNAELQEARRGREAAEAATRALTTSLRDLQAKMERETARLNARVAELEAMPKGYPAPASTPGLARLAALSGWRFLLRTVARIAAFIARAAKRFFQ
jgi:hypothetical protein